jgi:hypothetical protein
MRSLKLSSNFAITVLTTICAAASAKTQAPIARARIGYNPKPNFAMVKPRQAEPP